MSPFAISTVVDAPSGWMNVILGIPQTISCTGLDSSAGFSGPIRGRSGARLRADPPPDPPLHRMNVAAGIPQTISCMGIDSSASFSGSMRGRSGTSLRQAMNSRGRLTASTAIRTPSFK